jgi:energy-coupling factor transport system ATP-binding protein
MNLVPALHNINLSIRQGEWAAITGGNGSGKSSLIRMINGLLQPAEGTVAVAGLDLKSAAHRAAVKQHVQMVFQNPDAQIIGRNPAEDIAFGLENRGINRDVMITRVEGAAEQVELRHKLFAEVSTLSGGQKQRLAAASSLALAPEILIFDEATSMLDPVGRQRILSIAKSLHATGVTVIWVTQRLQELFAAKRILVLDAGRIRFDGDARSLFYESDIPDRYGWENPPIVTIGKMMREQGIPLQALPLDEAELGDIVCELNCQE